MTLTEIGIITGQSLSVRFAGGRHIASFPHVEVKEGMCLASRYGEGRTPYKAKIDYAKKLCGAKIAVNALSHNATRLDLQLPPKINCR